MTWRDGRLTDEFGAGLLRGCRETASARVDPEHFLIALLAADDGPLAKECRRLRPTAKLEALRQTVVVSSKNERIDAPDDVWSEGLLSDRSRQMLDEATHAPDWREEQAERLIAVLIQGGDVTGNAGAGVLVGSGGALRALKCRIASNRSCGVRASDDARLVEVASCEFRYNAPEAWIAPPKFSASLQKNRVIAAERDEIAAAAGIVHS